MNDCFDYRLGFRDEQRIATVTVVNEELGSVIAKKGSFVKSMGVNKGNFVFLNALETLYLLEKKSICLQVGKVPLSLQEAFIKYWKIEYQSFKELRTLGFSIKFFQDFQRVYKPRTKSKSTNDYDFQVVTVDANSNLSLKDLRFYKDLKMQVAIVDGSDVSFIKINSVQNLLS